MNLVKWLRKNNTKIMAVVVIVLMIGFIGGSSLSYLLRGRNYSNKTLAYYGNNIKVRNYDLLVAQQEMEILKALQANQILMAIPVPVYKTPDLHALVLGELLFSEQRPSPDVLNYIMTNASRNQLRISEKEINDIYNRNLPGYYYWFILNKEAENAGFRVQNEISQSMLNQAAEQLFKSTYSQYVGNLMRSNAISEDKILTTFGKLLALLRYSHAVCEGQDVTTSQLKFIASSQEESLDVEFVRFDANDFTKSLEAPSEERMAEQFNKFRQYYPGEVSDDNPYGFGYKLPARVRLEYMVVKLDEIKDIVKEPTSDELEEYYLQYKDSTFSEMVPEIPGDPNSKKVSKPKRFSEVADSIFDQLMDEKITNKATTIITEARNLGDGTLQDINDTEFDKLSTEDRKELAGSYKSIAEDLSTKYKVPVYEGTTGELSAVDIQTDDYLSTLYLQGYAGNLGLARLAFAVDKLKIGELGPYEITKPRVYLSLGPVKDRSEKIMAVVRVVDTIESSVPEDINQEFSTASFAYDPNYNAEKKIFSIKDNVTKDLKRLTAMDTAKARADEFIELAVKEGQTWESAVKEINIKYGRTEPNDVNDPNAVQVETAQEQDANMPPFELQNMSALRRLTRENLYTLSLLTQGNPAAGEIERNRKKGALFVDRLFSLAPVQQDSNTPEFKPEVIVFEPDLSYYAIKNISVTPLWKEDYERVKAIDTFTEDFVESQSLAFVQFNPENIFKRMNFRLAEEEKQSITEEPNAPEE